MRFNYDMKESLLNASIPDLPSVTKELLKGKKLIFDLGIGSGWLTNYIDEDAEYHGITYRYAEKEFMNNKGYKNIRVVDIEEQDLPYKDSYFDLVYAGDVFEHLQKHDVQRMMTECCRILKPGGVMIIVTPTNFNPFFHGEWSHVKPYNHDSLPALMRQFGFRDVDWEYPTIIGNLPKVFQRYARFPLFFLKPWLWHRIMSYGYKK